MGNKLYVGNLPYSANDEALSNLFAEAGTVTSARVITDRDSGRSKGFAFVEMSNDEEAANAISKLDGKEFEGRTIRVSEARPLEPRENRGASGGRRNFGRGDRNDRGNRGPRGGGHGNYDNRGGNHDE